MRKKSLLELEGDYFNRNQIPFSCHFDLTYYCNIKCVHCYIVDKEILPLTTMEIKDILSQLAAAGTLYLHFSGGEIFTRRDFFEIAEYARKLHFALILSTNGTLIDEEVADKIARLKPYKVIISIYGSNAKIHDGITRISGSFKNSLNAVKLLKQRGLWVNINNTLMKQNIHDYHNVYQLAKSLDANFKVDPQITPQMDGNINPIKFQIDAKDLYRVMSDPLIIELESETSKYNYENVKHGINKNNDNTFSDIPCNASHSYFYISPYGDVYPCVQFPISAGNLKEKPFSWIWNNSPSMLKARSLRMSQITVCSKCENLNYCNYCPGLAYLEAGNIKSPYQRACQESEIKSKINKVKTNSENSLLS